MRDPQELRKRLRSIRKAYRMGAVYSWEYMTQMWAVLLENGRAQKLNRYHSVTIATAAEVQKMAREMYTAGLSDGRAGRDDAKTRGL